MGNSAFTVSGSTNNSGIATPVTVSNGGQGNTSLTNHGVLLGAGTSPVTAQTLADGELLIGVTGSAPAHTTLTAGSNITITNAPGSITIDAASASSPSWNLITSTSISGNPSTISFTSASITNYNNLIFTFSNVTASATNIGIFLGCSTNGGSTYAVSSSIYTVSAGSAISGFSYIGAPVQLIYNSPSFSPTINGWVQISNSNVTDVRSLAGGCSIFSGTGAVWTITGYVSSSAQLNALQFSLSSGTFVSGTIKLYGV